jgi:hypothetical protein
MPPARSWLLCVVLGTTLGAGCGFPPLPGAPDDAESLEVRGFPDDVISAEHSGFPGQRRLVIRDSAAWLAFWDTLMAHTRTAAPPVNFEQDMVIAAALGRRANTGYSIQIDQVQAHAGDFWVHVRGRTPNLSCVRLPVETSPVTAVRVTRQAGHATFVERGEVIVC